jgi:parvulin-like peptidyl-prolyl isomerase
MIKPVTKDKLESKINELKNKIKTEGFENVAMNLSISESAAKGGDLGWLNENVISKKYLSKIAKTSIGHISEPIFLTEGILIFKIRNKRKIKRNIEEEKNQLVNAEKTKILRMHSLSHYDKLERSISVKFLND